MRPICQKCGAPLDPGGPYCPGCGARVGDGTEGAAPLPPPYTAAPAAGRSKTPLLIAIAVLVAVIVLAALASWNAQDRTNNEGGVRLSLVDLVDPAPGTLPADAGFRYVQVIITLTNEAGGDVALEPSDFELIGNDGSTYHQSEYATADMPAVVTQGSSATLTLGFEVPEGVQPVKIVYNGRYA